MRWKVLALVLVVAGAACLTPAARADDTKLFTITGVNYTKWLWGTDRFDGSLYNFTSIPGEGFGDNGQGTELELLVSAKPSKKVEVTGRMKARFNQNFWTNGGGFGGGGAGQPGSGDCIGGDCGEFDSRSAQYVKFRGLTINFTPGYAWLDNALVGSSDFGMFDPFTIGKIRYIDRDNNAGILLQGSFKNRKVTYDFTRMSLNRLVYGPDFNTGDYPVQDATYGLQLKFNPSSKADVALHYSYTGDVEIDVPREDDNGNPIGDFNRRDGRDLTTRFKNNVAGLRLGFRPNSTWDFRLAAYSSSADSDKDFAPASFFGISGFSPVPAGKLSDESYKLNVDVNDPFGNGLSFNFEYFDIGADYVSIMAARRESDVLLTEGHDSTWAWPGPDNISFGVFNQGNRRIGYGGWQGNAQQVATINVDNEFTDFDEPMAETVIGWKGFTIVPVWVSGNLELAGEYTFVDYNTNWQAWDMPNRAILDSIYPNHESDAGVGSYRNAYAPFQDKETTFIVLKGKYFFDVGNGLELFGKLKWIDETDKRMTDARFLPYQAGDCPTSGVLGCANNRNNYFDDGTDQFSTADLYGNPGVLTNSLGQTGYQWKPFDSLTDDDRDMDYTMFALGASYQLTNELWGSLRYESYDVELQDGNTAFQAYQLHEMASGQHDKDKIILELKYNLGGAEMGLNYEYNDGSFEPNFGGGFVPTLADQGVQDEFGYRVGTRGFRGRFGGWNSLENRDYEQQRLKAFLKLFF